MARMILPHGPGLLKKAENCKEGEVFIHYNSNNKKELYAFTAEGTTASPSPFVRIGMEEALSYGEEITALPLNPRKYTLYKILKDIPQTSDNFQMLRNDVVMWTGSQWVVVFKNPSTLPTIPSNPVCAYTFIDLRYKIVLTHGKITSSGIYRFKAFDISEHKGKNIKITASGYKIGGGGDLHLFVHDDSWTFKESIKIDSTEEQTKVLEVSLPTQYFTLYLSLCHSPKTNNSNTVILSKLRVETLAETQLIDSSGNNLHISLVGDLKEEKNSVFRKTLSFFKGRLTRPAYSFIGVGKQWSHVRWIKINSEQDPTSNPRLWSYGSFDYAFFDIERNGGVIGNVSLATHKDNFNQSWYTLDKEKLIDNKYHCLIVVVDLQPTYVKKTVYLDGIKLFDHNILGNFNNWTNSNPHTDMGLIDWCTKGNLASLVFFDRLLTEQEIFWLSSNPMYSYRNYTPADWQLNPNNPESETAVRMEEDSKRYTKEEINRKIQLAINNLPTATQGDSSDQNPQVGLGVTKTVNRAPSIQECQKNEPWSASPNWVFKLLIGEATSDVNDIITEKLQTRVNSNPETFCCRGMVEFEKINSTVKAGTYTVKFPTYTGCLLVFTPYGSTGIVQFFKAGYGAEVPWKYRNAVNSDTTKWTEWRTILTQDNFKVRGSTLEITL